VQGFVVSPNTLISLPPDWAMQVELLAKLGDSVRAAGYATPSASGMQIMQPQTLSVAGRTLNVAEPSLPAPYAGTGVIRSLNYGPQGEMNGFVLQSGIIALTLRWERATYRLLNRAPVYRFPDLRGPLPLGGRLLTCKLLPRMVRPSR
jgi:hypothetical protein